MNKLLITIGAAIGGIIGAYVPFLWGDTDMFSGWSILLATVGGIVGIWAGFKLARRIG